MFSIAGFKEDAHDIDENVNLEGISIDYEKVKSQVDHFTDLHLKMINMFLIKRLKRLMDTLEGKIRIVDEGGHF